MMLKVNGEYLDFNDSVEIERQAKVFEELSKTAGDFSYQFEIVLTSDNIRILQCPFPDNILKNVYHKVTAEVIGDDGITVQHGFIRIERISGLIAYSSFFSGNNNWFNLLTGPLSDIDFSDLDVNQDTDAIMNSWESDSGIVFPLVDNDTLTQRRDDMVKVEDFVPAIYVHTVIKRIFQKHSIKINGELFDDVNYKMLIVTRSPSDEVESRSAYVGKSDDPQVIVGFDPPALVTFTDDSNYPFFDGTQNNYNLGGSGYTADVKMRLIVEVSVTFFPLGTFQTAEMYIVIDGNPVSYTLLIGAFGDTISNSVEVTLEAGQTAAVLMQSNGDITINLATARFTPTYIYKAFANRVVPEWTQQEFVSNIFQLFNTLASYEPISKTLTVNLFEKIKQKPPIDISEYISLSETDYADFISNYAKNSLALYETIEFDDWTTLGISTVFSSGDGVINIDNDFIDESNEIIESEFTNPHSYLNNVFGMSMERLKTLRLEPDESASASSVTDSSGAALFHVTGAEDIFTVGDLVRISDSTVENYNGDWIVGDVDTGEVAFYNLFFVSDSTATLTILRHVYSGDDNVYLLFNIPNYSVSKFSVHNAFSMYGVPGGPVESFFSTALGYFNVIDTGQEITEEHIQSASFGEVSNMFFYQRTMLETYWNLASRVLNDPVKQIVTVNIPLSVYKEIDFLSPINIKTIDSSNIYYPNRMTGYKGKEYDCEIELIKLP